MEQEAAPKPKKPTRWKKWLRWIGGIFIGLLLLLLSLQLVFLFFSDAIVGSVLKSAVEDNSNRLYHLEYDSIRLDLAKKSLYMSEVRIIHDSLRLKELEALGEAPKTMAEMYLPSLEVVDEGISRFYFTQRLQLKHIHLRKPELVLSVHPQATDSNQYNLLRIPGLYPLLSKYLDAISVADILLHKGTLRVKSFEQDSLIDFRLKNINVEMTGVRIDSSHTEADSLPFDFDRFEIDIRNNRFPLQGQEHQLELDQFWLGYPENKVELWGIRWISELGQDTSFVKLKDLTLNGIDLRKLYLSRQLVVDNLEVSSGSGAWTGPIPEPQEPSNTPFDPYQQVQRYLRQIEVNRVLFNNMAISWSPEGVPKSQHLELENFLVLAQGFRLDSNSSSGRSKQLYSDNVDLVITDFSRDLPDGLHRFSASEMMFSTAKQEITGSKLSVIPRINNRQFAAMRSSTNNLFQVDLPNCKVTGVDLWEWYNNRLILGDQLVLKNPKLRLVHRSDSIPHVSQLDIRNLYPLLEGSFKSVSFNRINLQNGQIKFESLGPSKVRNMAMSRINIDLNQFLLNDRSYFNKEALLYSRDFRIKAGAGTLLLADSIHRLDLNNLVADSKGGLFSADAFKLGPLVELVNDSMPPDSNKGTLDMGLTALRIENFDYRKAYYEQDFRMDQMQFLYPKIVIRGGPQPKLPPKLSELLKKRVEIPLVADYVSNLKINELEIDSANIDLFTHWQDTIPGVDGHGVYLCVQDLGLDTNRLRNSELLFETSDLDLRAKRYSILLDKGQHRLNFKNLQISQVGQTIMSDQVTLQPIAKYRLLGKRNVAEMQVPGFKLEGIDILKAYRDREVRIEKVTVKRPNINLMLSKQDKLIHENQPQLEVDSLYRQFLEGSFKTVKVDSLKLMNGRVDLIRFNKDNITSTSLGDVSLKAQNFFIDSNSVMDSVNFFFADDIDLLIHDYQNQLADSVHLIEAAEIRLSTRLGEVGAINLHIHPNPQMDSLGHTSPDSLKKPLVNAFFPKIDVKGVNLQNALVDRKLKVDSVQLFAPTVEIKSPVKQAGDAGSVAPSMELVQEKLLGIFEVYQIEKIQFDNAFVDLGKQCLPNLEGEVSNFLLDSLTERDVERPMFADDWTVGMKDYHLPLGDERYELQLGEVRWSTESKRLQVNQLALVPFDTKYGFAPHFNKQTDWINLTTERLELVDLDFDGLLYQQKIKAAEMLVDSLHMEIFRDKRLPFPKNQRPPVPQQLLKDFNYYVWLDSISLTRSFVQYEEHALGGRDAGRIYFSELQAKAYSVSNDSAFLSSGALTRLNAEAKVMGAGALKANFEFDLGSAKNAYTYKASLGPMDLTLFNPMMENVAFAKVKKGQVNSLNFNVTANDDFAVGRMRFYYRHLKISLVAPDADRPGFKRSVGSALANAFVINTANPKFIFPRTGNIYFERRPSRSIFNYWAYTAFSGLKFSVGHKIQFKKAGKRSEFLERIKFKSYSWD